eukprot:4232159-Lingulodinium_polyedra.AAC.1
MCRLDSRAGEGRRVRGALCSDQPLRRWRFNLAGFGLRGCSEGRIRCPRRRQHGGFCQPCVQ